MTSFPQSKALQVVSAAKKIIEMAQPGSVTQTTRYYHGVSKQATGEKIVADGELRLPSTDEIDKRYGQRYQRPAGGVYLTPQLRYAVIYALGGQTMGSVDPRKPSGYGYLFVVDGSQLTDVEPDEDVLGELIWSLGTRGSFAADKAQYDQHTDHAELLHAIRADPALLGELQDAFERHTTAHTRAQAEAGEAIWQSKAGKQLVRGLPPALRSRLVDLGSHLSARQATVPWSEAWRILKSDSAKLDRAASNFFEVAERVA